MSASLAAVGRRLPGVVLAGKVASVAQLADSRRSWLSGGSKQFPAVVTLDKPPPSDVKPGMRAEVRILAATIPDALVVPIQAVAEISGDRAAYVAAGNAFLRRDVKIGQTNDRLVQILEGIDEGEQVALDARLRALAETKERDEKEAAGASPKAKPASSGPMR